MNVSTTIQEKIRKVSTANAANPISSLNSEIGKFTNLRSALRNGAVGYRLTGKKASSCTTGSRADCRGRAGKRHGV